MNCWAILFCNKCWITDLSPCFQQFDPHSVYLLFYFFKEKPVRNWLTHFGYGYTQFLLGWISETTHSLFWKSVSIWKIIHVTVQVPFFIKTILFSIITIYVRESTLQHLQNLCIFTHIRRNTYAVSHGVTDRKNGALHGEPRWSLWNRLKLIH